MQIGTEVALECNATGNPVPSITWLENGNTVSSFPLYHSVSYFSRLFFSTGFSFLPHIIFFMPSEPIWLHHLCSSSGEQTNWNLISVIWPRLWTKYSKLEQTAWLLFPNRNVHIQANKRPWGSCILQSIWELTPFQLH